MIIVFVLGFSIFSALRLQNLRFDYDFEAFFPNEDHELEVYNNYRKTFEYDNEFALVAIENRDGVFRKDFLLRVDSLTQRLAGLQYVQRVSSPTNLRELSFDGLLPVQTRLLHFEDESLYPADSAKIYDSPWYVGSYFPENARSLSIYIKTDDVLSKDRSDALADNIAAALADFHFDDVHYVGRIFAQNVYLRALEKEFVLFMTLSFLVVVLFLWFSFKSLYGILVPVTVVVVSVLWTLSIMNLLGKPIDLMSSMLPTMIFIAGMSDVVHFFSKYFEELSAGRPRAEIYPLILKEVGFPTFLTLLTTVVGFLSLLFSDIRPIRDFGIYTSVGVTIAFVLTYTLLPALLYFFTPQRLIQLHRHDNRTYSIMRRGLFWIFRHQKTILVITGLAIVLSAIGIGRIRVNNLLLEDLSEKVKIKQDFNFFDRNYSGVRPLEILVTVKAPGKTVWDYDVLLQLNKVDEFIKHEYDAGFLVSPASFVKSIYLNSNHVPEPTFPDKESYETIEKQLKNNRKNRDVKRLITADGRSTRISAKIRDAGSIAVNAHNQRLLAFLKYGTDAKLLEFHLTGAAHLVDKNNEYMVSNMTQGFIFSIAVIAVLTFFLHRSWRMVLVFIIPNVIPLLIIGGIMGYAGIELKAATSLVFSIAFGIATDDTIHFISRLRIELGYGKSLLYAFKRTYFETGKPILLTTFILMGGFMSLMLSNFQSVFYFGFLICITVVVAVLADIFLLPVLLFLIYGRTRKKQ